MQELIDELPESSDVEYLIDTCFLAYCFQHNKEKQLLEFCKKNKVGMSTFNLAEFVHMHHKLHSENHQVRKFLKEKILYRVPIDINPGEREKERQYVEEFNTKIMEIVKDASDAVLFVLAIKIRANILTRDKHHVFNAVAENYFNEWNEKILNGFP